MGWSEHVGLQGSPAFDGKLETPSRVVSVDIVPGKKVLEQNVPYATTRIRIWLNHPVEPDNVTIGLD